MPNPIPPENYRSHDFMFDGKETSVFGMARPDRGGHNIEESMEFLKDQAIDVIISLDYKKIYDSAATSVRIDYRNMHIPDFQPPTIQQCNDIYDMVQECSRSNTTVAIHCGAGHGRTGTVLAAMKLRERIEQNPLMDEHQSQSSMLRVGHYGGNKFITCTPLVREAVDYIRQANDSEGSVEIGKQIEMLTAYQTYLINERRKSNNKSTRDTVQAIPIDHAAIKTAKDVIDILKNQLLVTEIDENRKLLTQEVNRLSNAIKKFTGARAEGSNESLNNLILCVQNVKEDLLDEPRQKELSDLKKSFGEKVEKPSTKDKLMTLAISIYTNIVAIYEKGLSLLKAIFIPSDATINKQAETISKQASRNTNFNFNFNFNFKNIKFN